MPLRRLLAGHYLCSDHCTALLRSFRWEAGRVVSETDLTRALDPAGRLSRVASFGEDHGGELYVASQDGAVFELVPSAR